MFIVDQPVLDKAPSLNIDDVIICPHCGEEHTVFGGRDENGNEINFLLAYYCGDKLYLAGIHGKLVRGHIVEHNGGL